MKSLTCCFAMHTKKGAHKLCAFVGICDQQRTVHKTDVIIEHTFYSLTQIWTVRFSALFTLPYLTLPNLT